MFQLPSNGPLSPAQTSALTPILSSMTSEQNIWLSGFLAGRASIGSAQVSQTTKASPTPITILFGTESGNAESLAADTQKQLKKLNYKPKLVDMADTIQLL